MQELLLSLLEHIGGELLLAKSFHHPSTLQNRRNALGKQEDGDTRGENVENRRGSTDNEKYQKRTYTA